MEKLIELLNKYEEEVKKSEIVWSIDNDWDICSKYKESVDYNDCIYYAKIPVLISKSYGFIQWLAKHFMLNVTKIDARIALLDFNVTDRMLMALAISEDPIALLVDCLKTEWTETIE